MGSGWSSYCCSSNMALRVQPRLWHPALMAAAGLLPFAACGGATSLNTDDSTDGGSAGTGGKTSAGGRPQAGRGGQVAGGASSVGGNGGVSVGGMVNVSGSAGAQVGGTAGHGGALYDNPFPCTNPQPFPIPGTGYELCAGDFIHRIGKAACPPGGECSVDEQCGPSRACVCQGNGYGSCQTAGCDSDSDCLPGLLCIGSPPAFACAAGTGLACQQPIDKCASNSGCGACSVCVSPIPVDGMPVGRACQPCCAVGRPFLVDGQARLANAARRSDWCSELRPNLTELSTPERAALADYWRLNGLMEHASVAAFSRFVLDLMSLGAPPTLIQDATQAMLDEAEHTKACFALASAYAGQPMGPGPLSMIGSLNQRDLREIVQSAVLEGCVGETVAALEAAEALAHATDEAVRAALTQIAADELRHAALAYRFVAWARQELGAVVDDYARRAFAQALRDAPPPPAADRGVVGHGLLSAEHRAELRARVLDELVTPCIPALLAA
jgi:hypothetical protein